MNKIVVGVCIAFLIAVTLPLEATEQDRLVIEMQDELIEKQQELILEQQEQIDIADELFAEIFEYLVEELPTEFDEVARLAFIEGYTQALRDTGQESL